MERGVIPQGGDRADGAFWRAISPEDEVKAGGRDYFYLYGSHYATWLSFFWAAAVSDFYHGYLHRRIDYPQINILVNMVQFLLRFAILTIKRHINTIS